MPIDKGQKTGDDDRRMPPPLRAIRIASGTATALMMVPGRDGEIADAENRGDDGGNSQDVSCPVASLPEGNLTVAIAWAAMPSRRPVKPRPSVVVALTLTRSMSIYRISAIRARMASRCGPTLGRSQMMVTSHMIDDAAFGAHQTGGMVQEFPRRRAAPAFIRGREMLADIAFADAAQQGIGEGMQARHRRRNGLPAPWLCGIFTPHSQT